VTRAIYAAFDVFPRGKGSSSHMASMVTALRGVCDQVMVLCLGGPGLPLEQEEGGIVIRRLPARYPDLLGRATAFAQFVTRHAQDGAALVVYRDPWGGAPLLRACAGTPSIFEVNALPSWELAYSRPGFAANPALQAKVGDMERFCLKHSDEILCVSSVTARALGRAGVTVIPNAAAPYFFGEAAGPCPVPELEQGRWFGYVGGMQPWQGVDVVFEAFRRLAPDLPGVRMAVFTERRAPRRLPEGVRFFGPLAHPALPGALRRLEFTVAPLTETSRNTVQGCCPVKMIESMAAGVPVAASNLAVCREWMEDGREGILVTPGDRRAWMQALYSMLGEAPRYAEAARRRAERDFSYAHVHRQLQTVFRRVLWN
jgi:glycosyltransferase involved in cell wall biosynthesis